MIDKTQLPLVSIEAINEIHFEEVDILNTLSNLIDEQDTDTITSQIKLLVEHMQKHFSFEEGLMKDKSYPMYTIHQADHNKVLSETRYILMDWRNTKDIDRLKEYFQDELIAWLDQHIKAMDMPMAEFLMSS
ncbi:MAG TPA: hemerythrin [Campylobacterales bacterium]|nr:hemerythrin [Campylobacterales bacterium]HIP59639.1 hemerythrin [Campylobacterales bacterium]